MRASGLVCRAVERKPQGFRTISCKLGLRSKRASDSLLLLTVEIELNSFAVALVLCLDASLTRDHIAAVGKTRPNALHQRREKLLLFLGVVSTDLTVTS